MPLPVIAAGAIKAAPVIFSALGKLFGNKSKANAAEEDRKMALANEQARAASVQNMLAQLKARGIDIYGPQTTTSQGTSTTTTNDKIRKVIDPLMRANAEQAAAQMQSEMNRDIFGPAQIAQLARDTNRGYDAALSNMAASRQLSPEQLNAMKFMSLASRTDPVLRAQAEAPAQNAAYRSGIRGEALNWTNATMGENRSGTSTTNSSDSRTSGPDLQALLALSQAGVPQQISTKTGYSPWGDILGAAGDLGGSLQAMFGGTKKPTAAGYAATFGTPGQDLYIPPFR
jgi:hypothetical protein